MMFRVLTFWVLLCFRVFNSWILVTLYHTAYHPFGCGLVLWQMMLKLLVPRPTQAEMWDMLHEIPWDGTCLHLTYFRKSPKKTATLHIHTHTNLQGNQNMHVFSNLNIVKREIWICYCTLTGSWRSDRQLNLWPEGSIIVHSLFLLYNGVSGTPWCRCCCAALALMWSRLPVKRPAKAATARLVLTPSCVIHSQSWLNTCHLRFLAELCLEVKAPKDLPADSLFCYEQVH